MSTKHRLPRRGRALQRLFVLATLIQENGNSMTLEQLHTAVNAVMFESWHHRTIRRDVELLVETGCVDLERVEPTRCKWLGFERIINGGLLLE